MVGIGEVGLDFSKMKHDKRLLSLFPDLGLESHSSISYNWNKSIKLHQQGGVDMLILGEAIPYYKPSSKDFRCLGRWDSSILEAKQSHRTRVEQANGVLPRFSPEIRSVYQQHT